MWIKLFVRRVVQLKLLLPQGTNQPWGVFMGKYCLTEKDDINKRLCKGSCPLLAVNQTAFTFSSPFAFVVFFIPYLSRYKNVFVRLYTECGGPTHYHAR